MTVQDEGVREDPVAAWDDQPLVVGIELGRAIAVAEDELVEPGQGTGRQGWGGVGAGDGVVKQGLGDEQVTPAERARDDPVGRGKPGASVGHREVRPSGQVVGADGSMAAHEALGDHRQSTGAVQVGARRRELVEQHEGLVLAALRPHARDALLAGVPEQVIGALPGAGDARGLEG